MVWLEYQHKNAYSIDNVDYFLIDVILLSHSFYQNKRLQFFLWFRQLPVLLGLYKGSGILKQKCLQKEID